MNGKPKIRVYSGEGALPMCSNASIFMLKDIFAEEVNRGALEITPIDHFELKSATSNWQDDCALLVFSGGGVTGFKNGLEDSGLRAIKAYMNNGGQYLGMCAGAYFGATEIDFTGHDWQSKKAYKKEGIGLGFFEGIAKGSIKSIAPLYDGTSATCRAIDVTLGIAGKDNTKAPQAKVFYGGGPEFLLPDSGSLTEAEIISYYMLENGQTAVAGLSCPIPNQIKGNKGGHALLLSWHADLNSKFIAHSISNGMSDPGNNRMNIAEEMSRENGTVNPAVKWLGQTLRKHLKI